MAEAATVAVLVRAIDRQRANHLCTIVCSILERRILNEDRFMNYAYKTRISGAPHETNARAVRGGPRAHAPPSHRRLLICQDCARVRR